MNARPERGGVYVKLLNSIRKDIHINWILYLFILPGLVFYILFSYAPMVGLFSSFQLYDPIGGILKSKFIGFHNFELLFKSPIFLQTVRNTVTINLLVLVFTFPVPVIFALMLNEVTSRKFKKINQTISYLPYFVSWVVVAGLWYRLLSPNGGLVNELLIRLGIVKEGVLFVGDTRYYYAVIILQQLWKNLGYTSIYYIAALATVDKELYDAALVDGTNRLQRMWYVSMPYMTGTIILIFILSLSNILNADYEQMINMINPSVRSIGDVIDTYVFRVLMTGFPADIGLGAALSMVKGAIGLLLFFTANRVLKKATGMSFI
jgi:putative aldouronate transport system permease protein